MLGVILPDNLLQCCVEAKTVSETSLHGSISVLHGNHGLLKFCFVLIGVSGDPQLDYCPDG